MAIRSFQETLLCVQDERASAVSSRCALRVRAPSLADLCALSVRRHILNFALDLRKHSLKKWWMLRIEADTETGCDPRNPIFLARWCPIVSLGYAFCSGTEVEEGKERKKLLHSERGLPERLCL